MDKKSKTSKKVRFVFGRDMSIGGMVDAVVRIAEEYGINIIDDRKKYSIPVGDRMKKKNKKSK